MAHLDPTDRPGDRTPGVPEQKWRDLSDRYDMPPAPVLENGRTSPGLGSSLPDPTPRHCGLRHVDPPESESEDQYVRWLVKHGLLTEPCEGYDGPALF
jgi:hypothetical protein